MLETGPQAPSVRFFDIDWHPVKEELEGRVLLPILEDQYGKVLEAGKLVLERDGGELYIRYYDNRLPLAPRSYASVLKLRSKELLERFDPEDDNLLEYRSIWASAHNLPPRTETDAELIEQKILEKEVIKRRLRRLCEECPALRDHLDGNIALFQGTPGDPSSFDLLHNLLEEQVYRLAYWRVAAEEINYRRFFDINDLAGLRVEDPLVFEIVHQLVFQWIDDGGVTGLRIDHPDGLADPRGYFQRLQETIFVHACRRRFEAEEHDEAIWKQVESRLRKTFRDMVSENPASPIARRFPVVAEKILSRGEDLPSEWTIDGTVGYEFLNALNGLFVDGAASDMIDSTYVEFTGDRQPFMEVLHESKLLITRAALASEVNVLARQLNRVSEGDRRSRDFTLNELRRALNETIACFPVYRTYVRPNEPVSARDRGYIEQAVARARRRYTAIDASLFGFLQEALLLESPEGASPAVNKHREVFVRRFQQTTGPVQAKGLEDTAFYRQVKLASLNEVGADPMRFGNSPSVFHALNSQRLSSWPGALGTTATHDTKRGEDARIRINVLSELSEEWRTRLIRWSRWNARKKVELNGVLAPDAREEYLLYQTLLGAWPLGGPEDAVPEGFVPRIQQYMTKAIREAKVNTSWTDPDSSYVETLNAFISEILEGPDAAHFLRDFLPFQRRVARIGLVHSLAQVLLKITSPGIPDIYQGCELWDFHLVDPDNRRPVDYALRQKMLDSIHARLRSGESRAELARALFHDPEDAAVKLFVTWTALSHRKDNPALYAQGAYRPLEAEGDYRANILAFARHREGRSVVAVAPRLVGAMMGDEAQIPPIGDLWGDTRLVAPEAGIPRRWRNLMTDALIEIDEHDGLASVPIADVLRDFPVALLIDES